MINLVFFELGCEVCVIFEDMIKNNFFVFLKNEIVFLVYSWVVYYFLKYLSEKKFVNVVFKYLIFGILGMSDGVW